LGGDPPKLKAHQPNFVIALTYHFIQLRQSSFDSFDSFQTHQSTKLSDTKLSQLQVINTAMA
jgi:hypothetical protein